jgi:hypothetical protein
MAIKFACSACGHNLSAPDKAAGRMAPCPKCKKKIEVPATMPPVAPSRHAPLLSSPSPLAAPQPAAKAPQSAPPTKRVAVTPTPPNKTPPARESTAELVPLLNDEDLVPSKALAPPLGELEIMPSSGLIAIHDDVDDMLADIDSSIAKEKATAAANLQAAIAAPSLTTRSSARPRRSNPKSERASSFSFGDSGLVDIGLGILLAGGGIAVTAASYANAAAQPGGGRYYVFYGVIIGGIWRFFRGLNNLMS